MYVFLLRRITFQKGCDFSDLDLPALSSPYNSKIRQVSPCKTLAACDIQALPDHSNAPRAKMASARNSTEIYTTQKVSKPPFRDLY